MIISVSSGVMASDVTTSSQKVTDTYKVDSTCLLLVTGSDTQGTFGDVFTAKLTSNVNDTGKKISFSVDNSDPQLGSISVVKASDANVVFSSDVDASSDVAFKMKSDARDLTIIEAGTYQATVTVTATCKI